MRSLAYRITDLSPFRDWASWAHAIDPSGHTVGALEIPPSRAEEYHAYLWWAGGQTTDLQTLPVKSSMAHAINASRQIVGWAATHGEQMRAFLWKDGAMSDLGTLPGYPESTAYAINNHGTIVGSAQGTRSFRNRAFRYQAGRIEDLGTLGGEMSCAFGVNDSEAIVGWAAEPDGRTIAFLWTDGRMTSLGTLGGNGSRAYAINDGGLIVGASKLPDDTSHACSWRGGRIADLAPNSVYSMAKAVNNLGHAVGHIDNRACLFIDGDVIDLNDRVPDLQGWTLVEASGINDLGQIVGYGRLRNQSHAFRLDPRSG